MAAFKTKANVADCNSLEVVGPVFIFGKQAEVTISLI